jgi:hypothetical protein
MSTMILTPEQRIRQRFSWFEEAERLGQVTFTCQRFGISRKTYYKWQERFAAARGDRAALLDRSRCPHLGPARLRALLLADGVGHVPSAVTIAKVLKQAGLTQRRRATPQRYRRVFVVPPARTWAPWDGR